MTEPRRHSLLLDILTHLAFAGLFFLAFILYKERLFSDTAYYLARIVNTQWFWVENNRLVLVFTQWLPLIGIWLKLPMTTILILYSLGNVIFFYGLYLLCRYRFQHPTAGFMLVALHTVGILHGFFVPIFELYYGAGLLVLFYVMYPQLSEDPRKWGLAFPILLLILLSHPIAVVLLVFVMVLHHLDAPKQWDRRYLHILGAMLAVFLLNQLAASDYDQLKMQAFLHNLNWKHFQSEFRETMFLFLIIYYHWLLILVFWAFVHYLARKSWLKLLYLPLAFIGTLGIISVALPGFEHSRYQEQVYFPLIFVSCFPYLMDVMPRIKRSSFIGMGIFLIWIFALRLWMIYQAKDTFSDRLTVMERLIDHTSSAETGQKFFINSTNISGPYADPNWSYPLESLIFSSAKGKAVSIATDVDLAHEDNPSLLTPDLFLLRRWDLVPHSRLNSHYFPISPGPYQALNSDGPLAEPLDTLKQTLEIDIHAQPSYARGFRQREVQIPVTVRNRHTTPLRSHMDRQVFLSYHWVQNGEMHQWEGLRTPLEVDIKDTYTQPISVALPQGTGTYTLVVDVVLEGIMWLNLDAKTEIEIR